MPDYTYSDFASFVRGRRVAVLGLGISNRPLIKVLAGLGAEIGAFDSLEKNNPSIQSLAEELRDLGITVHWSLGANYLDNLQAYDLIFRTPKMRHDLPQILAERRRGAILSSEMEVFMALCPAPITAITGSDGKTTTTTIVSELLKKAGHRVWCGGNIGTPLLDKLPEIKAEDRVVLELSSFQLLTMSQSPQTAIITNISPNHLDVHKDYAEYIGAKLNICAHQKFLDRLILNGANEETARVGTEAKGQLIWVEKRPYGDAPLFGLDGDDLYYQEKSTTPKQLLLSRSEIKVPGRFNAVNFLAAAAATWPLISEAVLRDCASSFSGVEHRIEYIRELDGITYYNSSIDSSPSRSINALSAFSENGRELVLIAGGQDKKCDYSGLGEAIVRATRRIVLCGSNSDFILASIQSECEKAGYSADTLSIVRCENYEEALMRARELAVAGDSVLLSPAGTSFDQFSNFEERGRRFKSLVQALTSEV